MGIDRRDDLGPFDIVGDVHGCGEELVELLGNLGYSKANSSYRHPMGRRLVFQGRTTRFWLAATKTRNGLSKAPSGKPESAGWSNPILACRPTSYSTSQPRTGLRS